MMGEHGRDEKLTPYKTSAGVPFIIRWPHQITEGKVVDSAYSSVDFAPTLLNMLGIDDAEFGFFEGLDFLKAILNGDLVVSDKHQIRYTVDTSEGTWAAAITQRFKLVLSNSDSPRGYLMQR